MRKRVKRDGLRSHGFVYILLRFWNSASMLRSRLVSGFLIVVGALLAAEIGLRVLQVDSLQYYYDMKRLHAFHPDYLVGLAPNQDRTIRHYAGLWQGRFTTNSLGYRGSPEPDGSPVIACLGDSLVMGFGVSDEETFCAKLAGINLHGKKHQAMNLGVDAFGSVGDYKRLKEASGQLNLDTVLLFVSPNDFTIPPELAKRGVRPDDLIDEDRKNHPELTRFFRIQFEATRISYLLHALKLSREQLAVTMVTRRESVRSQMVQAGLSQPEEGDRISSSTGRYILEQFYAFKKHATCEPEKTSNAQASCPETVPDQAGYACIPRPAASELEPLSAITMEVYRNMISLAREKNFRLVPVFLPVQVEELYCDMHGKHHALGNYAVRAQAFFEKEGIRTIDLADKVPDICKLEKHSVLDQIIPGDGHLTKSGNIWAARALREKLNAL
jgi:hypothetical protein